MGTLPPPPRPSDADVEAQLFVELCALTKRYVHHVAREASPTVLMVELTSTLEAVAENLVCDFVPDADPHVVSGSLKINY